MKHTYSIKGMTCGGCKASVTKNLENLNGIDKVDVSFEKEEVTITMHKHLEVATLQKALPLKYSIVEKESVNITASASTFASQTVAKTKLQQLKPLFLILLYITVASVLIHYKKWSLTMAMLDFMGLFFIVFSFFKMLDLKGFPESFKMYDPLAKKIPVYGWLYPFIETVLGIMFLIKFEVKTALIITLIVLGITTVGVTKTLLDKKSIQCACLGTALKLPMTEATFIENAIMIVMAIGMLLNIF